MGLMHQLEYVIQLQLLAVNRSYSKLIDPIEAIASAGLFDLRVFIDVVVVN